MYSLFVIIIHQSILSRSQVLCPPNQDCAISCDANNAALPSCSQQTVDSSQALSLSLHCSANSCRDITVLCPLSNEALCNVYCDGVKSCASIYGTPVINSSYSATLNLHCIGDHACALMYIYGPLLNASIVCNGYYSCSTYGSFGGILQPHFYLSETDNVEIDCNGDSSCRGNYFFVEYSNNVYITNDGGDHAMEYSYIYGSYIKNILSIQCKMGYQNCHYLYIYCPATGLIMANNEAFMNDIHLLITNEFYSNIHLIGYDYELICRNNNIHNELTYNRTSHTYRCTDANNGCCPDYFITKDPTTASPSTSVPTTASPTTTTTPTTAIPTTYAPSPLPTTRAPTTNVPTTVAPTTSGPTTHSPISATTKRISSINYVSTDTAYYSNGDDSGNMYSYLFLIVALVVFIICVAVIGLYVRYTQRIKVLNQHFVELENDTPTTAVWKT